MIDAYDYVTMMNQKSEGSISLLLQIHDELVFEVRDDVAEECSLQIAEILEGVLRRRKLSDLPLIVSRTLGKNLNEM